eukprot:539938_1
MDFYDSSDGDNTDKDINEIFTDVDIVNIIIGLKEEPIQLEVMEVEVEVENDETNEKKEDTESSNDIVYGSARYAKIMSTIVSYFLQHSEQDFVEIGVIHGLLNGNNTDNVINIERINYCCCKW